MFDVQEVGQIQDLDGQRAVWRSLLDQTAGANFFQSLDWLEVYWRHYGDGQRLRVLTVAEDGQPVGILPLVVRREWRRIGAVRVLTYPLDDWGSFYGPIGPRPYETLAAGLNYIARSRRDWDAIDLRWADPTHEAAEHTRQALTAAGFQAYESERATTAIVDIRGSWNDYLAARTSKWRNNLKRWRRRLEALGEVTLLRHRPPPSNNETGDPRWDLYDECVAIANKSWQGASASGTTLSHGSVAEYLRDAHAAAARAGGVDLNLLQIDGAPIAFAYNYYYRGHVFGLRVGYDPEAARDGAGNMLYAMALEDSFLRCDHTYDMGPGSLECKRHFIDRYAPVMQYAHYHPTAVAAQLVRLKHHFRRWLGERRNAKEPVASA